MQRIIQKTLFAALACGLIVGCSHDGPSNSQVLDAFSHSSYVLNQSGLKAEQIKDAAKVEGCKADPSRESATGLYYICDITMNGETHPVPLSRNDQNEWTVDL